MKTINVLSLCLAALLFTGCSSYNFPWLYRMEIEEGNVIDEDKLAQVTIGMTKAQVEYLLGTALIKDTFNPDRWDYYYSLRDGDGLITRKNLKLTFDGNVLASMEETLEEEIQLEY